ncbi:ATP-dependent DNA helicase RecQ [Propionicimonas paludicola]|uniref:DNA 3'-5' helicase n=1 Tax=Propionicimonas paludicola TaxID=185243 RepID=A0A2A9CWX8_9ACTN|nr:RecQ family ATP-dependent DNA helicase [Propionicimonas paludicola]PFG18079.1 ATP-dependent DNA helicase RecQ [Propionicimonas paludicola]
MLDALAALRRLVGNPDADFRDGQAEAIQALVADRRRALVVQRTGWGKSAVYFVTTMLRRAEGAGPTLIVSPLLALMRDQIGAAERAGIRAVTLNSSNATQWDEVREALRADAVDLLLVSPERLNNPGFREHQLPDLAERCGLLVIDEAHCISDWGHDFRPDYRRIKDLLADLPASTPVLATTATANARVVADVAEQLSVGADGSPHEVLTLRGGLARDSLRLGVLPMASPVQRLAWLHTHLAELPGSGIIYTLTVAGAEDLARSLRSAGHEVAAYTGRTDTAERELLEGRLRANEVKALVATSALGMGFDKPDLGFVLHLGAPSSPVAYYQQVGRAGRATERADVVLLPGREDAEIWHYFATSSMPQQERAEAVIGALAEAGRPLSTAALEAVVDIRRSRLELLLKVLDVEGAVQRVTGGWVATGRPWSYDAERYERVAAARDREQQLMVAYETTSQCRMRFLQEALDDPSAADCGRCDTCLAAAGQPSWFDAYIDESKVALAEEQLAQLGVEIEPRSMWPTGMDRLGIRIKGRIAPDASAASGRAVARLTDLGWGSELRALFAAPDAPLPTKLAAACVEVLKAWPWDRRPVAVVAMPSAGRPQLLDSLARGLAQVGRLQYLGAIDLVRTESSGPGGNSAFRLADVWGRFAISPELASALAGLDGPVLLVDDLADSRWTLTVAAKLLREAGADEVLPFALAVVA